ncbi:hypothetical protein ABKN59_011808 [Abortiporus biennis]
MAPAVEMLIGHYLETWVLADELERITTFPAIHDTFSIFTLGQTPRILVHSRTASVSRRVIKRRGLRRASTFQILKILKYYNMVVANETKAVAVYCASSLGNDKAYGLAAFSLGKALAEAGRPLVYGSGSEGIMGVISGAALLSGGHVIGVVPAAMMNAGGEVSKSEYSWENIEEFNVALTMERRNKIEYVLVDSVHARKAEMARRTCGFVALPGGIGTMEEIFEALTLSQIGYHDKPLIVLNVLGYFDSIKEMIRSGVQKGFIYPENEGLIHFVDGPQDKETHATFDWGKAALQALDSWNTVVRMNQYDFSKTTAANSNGFVPKIDDANTVPLVLIYVTISIFT